MTVRIEVMLEEVTALGFRGNGATAEQVSYTTVAV